MHICVFRHTMISAFFFRSRLSLLLPHYRPYPLAVRAAQVAIEEAKAAKRRQQRRAIRRASGRKAGVRSTDALSTADPLIHSAKQSISEPSEATRASSRPPPAAADSPTPSALSEASVGEAAEVQHSYE